MLKQAKDAPEQEAVSLYARIVKADPREPKLKIVATMEVTSIVVLMSKDMITRSCSKESVFIGFLLVI